MHPANIELDRERTVVINFINEADLPSTAKVIPHSITFGRGSWWLQGTNVDTAHFMRIRMSRITLWTKL